MNGQHHFICRRSIVECLIFITQPQELLLPVTLADINELNDARLLAVASERMAHFDPTSLISEEEMNRRLGVTEDDLAGFDEVEIE